MTTAFLIKVDLKAGTRYVRSNGRYSSFPVFIRSAVSVRNVVNNPHLFSSVEREKTTIVKVEELEKGLRASRGEQMSIARFNEWFQNRPSRYESPKNTMYRVLYKDKYGRFQNYGDKVWTKTGPLRNHLVRNPHILLPTNGQPEYFILAIQMKGTNVEVENIKRYPIAEWMQLSPNGKKAYWNLRGSEFEGDIIPRSEYA